MSSADSPRGSAIVRHPFVTLLVIVFAIALAVEVAARSTFYAICGLHGGVDITRKAEVRGFLYDKPWGCSGDCADMLGRNSFEFIEREITQPRDFALPKDRGKYR